MTRDTAQAAIAEASQSGLKRAARVRAHPRLPLIPSIAADTMLGLAPGGTFGDGGVCAVAGAASAASASATRSTIFVDAARGAALRPPASGVMPSERAGAARRSRGQLPASANAARRGRE